MATVRCKSNEHNYDDTKYNSCPHCKTGRGNYEQTVKDPKFHSKSNKIDEEEKTVAPWAKSQNKKKSEQNNSDAPIVGWLVILNGLRKGRDFRIIPGINTIGRGNKNTINIDNKDSEISREAHCLIEYDIKSGQFYLERGTTSTYHNGSRVGGNGNELAKNDTIEIGNTTLRFIPFCDNDFCWEM